MKRLGRAPERNHRVTFNWFEKHKPFAETMCDFMYEPEDFVNLAGHADKERRMKNSIEAFLDIRPNSKLTVWLCSPKRSCCFPAKAV
jgi:hypothetical protein